MFLTPAPLAIGFEEVVVGVAGVLDALVAVEELDEVPAAALFAGRQRRGAGRSRLLADDREVAELDLRFAVPDLVFDHRRQDFFGEGLQTGHWRSPNSTSSTGAFGSPRTIPCCGIPASSRFTSATPSRLPCRRRSLLVALTTIRTSDDGDRQEDGAARPSCSSCCGGRSVAHLAPLAASASRSVPRVADQPVALSREEDRHQDGAGDAPLADRFDHEQLDVGEVDAVAEAAEGDDEAAEAGDVAGEEGAAPAAARSRRSRRRRC